MNRKGALKSSGGDGGKIEDGVYTVVVIAVQYNITLKFHTYIST